VCRIILRHFLSDKPIKELPLNPGTDQPLIFRAAGRNDLAEIVQMLADDELGALREDSSLPVSRSYVMAFEAITSDPNNELIIAVQGDVIVGVMQITFIPYLTYKGSWRALFEGVRVSGSSRSKGIGSSLIKWAIDHSHRKGCVMVQLTTDKRRPDAVRFYEKMGFTASHEGMKMLL
jgi:GNAT superfamily N-acetyltransferase